MRSFSLLKISPDDAKVDRLRCQRKRAVVGMTEKKSFAMPSQRFRQAKSQDLSSMDEVQRARVSLPRFDDTVAAKDWLVDD
jgi:hypothetical protein